MANIAEALAEEKPIVYIDASQKGEKNILFVILEHIAKKYP